jgi:hypothetical protein
MREAESRVRKDQAGENLALLRQMSPNVLNQEQAVREGSHAKRLRAGGDLVSLLVPATLGKKECNSPATLAW